MQKAHICCINIIVEIKQKWQTEFDAENCKYEEKDHLINVNTLTFTQ